MSVQVMAWVFAEAPQDLKPAEMLVAISLANHASSDGGHAYPSVPVMMSETRLSRRAVQSSLRSLEERGVIEVEREATRRLPAMYAFCAFRGANPATSEKTEAQPVPDDAQIVLVEAQILPLRGAEIAPKPSVVTVREPSDEPLSPPLPPSDEKPFALWEAFCTATGRDWRQADRKAKGKALREAKPLVEDGITAQDISGCAAYMQSQSWRTGILTFGQVAGFVGEWIMAGRREHDPPPRRDTPHKPSFRDVAQKLQQMEEQKREDAGVRGARRTWGPWGYLDEDSGALLDEVAGNGNAQHGAHDQELAPGAQGPIEARYRVGS